MQQALEIGLSVGTQRCASVCYCLFSYTVAPSNDIPLLPSVLVSASVSLHASLEQSHRCAERDTKGNITSVPRYFITNTLTTSQFIKINQFMNCFPAKFANAKATLILVGWSAVTSLGVDGLAR